MQAMHSVRKLFASATGMHGAFSGKFKHDEHDERDDDARHPPGEGVGGGDTAARHTAVLPRPDFAISGIAAADLDAAARALRSRGLDLPLQARRARAVARTHFQCDSPAPARGSLPDVDAPVPRCTLTMRPPRPPWCK